MASISVMFMDAEFGIQTYGYQIKDEDLKRLYKASCINRGMDTEYFDKRRTLDDTPVVKEIAKDLADDFVKRVVQSIYNLELANAQKEAQDALVPINIIQQNA